jgi:hypothetical protein
MSQNDFDKMMVSHYLNHQNKRAVIMTSRVHPGEAQASWVFEGFSNFLLSNDFRATQLRKHFVFIMVPMLNPDGVIYGNYRCNLLGVDLNRRWLKPHRFLHPTIFHTKKLVRVTAEERKVLLYCDLHGHSRKMNSFTYGCTYKGYEFESRRKNAMLRLIPLLMSRECPLYTYKDCRFRLEKSKESTARIVLFKEYHIMNCFTLESTYYGPDQATALKRHKFKKESEKLDKHMDE